MLRKWRALSVTVSIVGPAEVAQMPPVRDCARMLINLLARASGIVKSVVISVPTHSPLATRVVPLADRRTDLRQAVLEGAAAIGAVPVVHADPVPRASIQFVIGPRPRVDGATRVHGERWWGGSSPDEVTSNGNSDLPIGPCVAAALAAGAAECSRGRSRKDAFRSSTPLNSRSNAPQSISGSERVSCVSQTPLPLSCDASGKSPTIRPLVTKGAPSLRETSFDF